MITTSCKNVKVKSRNLL